MGFLLMVSSCEFGYNSCGNIPEMSSFAMRYLLVVFLVFGLISSPVWAQAEDASLYNITDVASDVTADSAVHARDQAIAEAQRSVLDMLLERLNAEKSVATKLSSDDIATLVQSFEVQNEKRSSVRYIGTFSVQFKPNAVRNF